MNLRAYTIFLCLLSCGLHTQAQREIPLPVHQETFQQLRPGTFTSDSTLLMLENDYYKLVAFRMLSHECGTAYFGQSGQLPLDSAQAENHFRALTDLLTSNTLPVKAFFDESWEDSRYYMHEKRHLRIHAFRVYVTSDSTYLCFRVERSWKHQPLNAVYYLALPSHVDLTAIRRDEIRLHQLCVEI